MDNFKQMLDSVNYDIRALLVKLADRLHNMRTLASMKPEKQLKIAGETDFFYGPLANRLGFYWIKTELENLSFQYRCPQEYSHLQQMLEKTRLITSLPLPLSQAKSNSSLTRISSRQRLRRNIVCLIASGARWSRKDRFPTRIESSLCQDYLP